MIGIKYMKADPQIFLQQYRAGKIIREGNGLQFVYYAPVTSLVAVPTAAIEAPFMFEEITKNFQQLTIQGHLSYRVKEPRKLIEVFNLTLKENGRGYVADDWKKLPQQIINVAKVLIRGEVQKLKLRDAIAATDQLAPRIRATLAETEELTTLGIDVLGFAILAVKPTPETARAFEAETREQLLQEADEALYTRRNAAVEQERAIKENELKTEIAIENKKREIRETKIEADRVIQEKQHQLEKEDLKAKTKREDQRGALVTLATENAKAEADAKAYGIASTMKAIGNADPKVLQALTTVGMDADHLIAMAFQGLADNAKNIGQLNITPDLLRELVNPK